MAAFKCRCRKNSDVLKSAKQTCWIHHTQTHTHTPRQQHTHTFLAPLWHRVHVNSTQGLSGKIYNLKELKWRRWWRETLCRIMWAVGKSQTNVSGVSGIQLFKVPQLLLLFFVSSVSGKVEKGESPNRLWLCSTTNHHLLYKCYLSLQRTQKLPSLSPNSLILRVNNWAVNVLVYG